MKFTVRVSKQACANKEEAMNRVGGFKTGWGATDEELSVQEIAEKWLAGYSIAPAKMQRGITNDANWISQQIFAVDVDNENGDGERANEDNYVTPEEILSMSKCAGLPPAVIYSSFSSTPDHQKFRVIFVLDEAVHTRELHNEVTAKLYSVFMKNGYCAADTRCRDLARVYYGGKDLLHHDYDAVATLTHIRQLSPYSPRVSEVRSRNDGNGNRQSDFLPRSRMHSNTLLGETTPALTALMNNDPLELREILHNGGASTSISDFFNNSTGPTNINPYTFIKKLPLHHLLGVPLNYSFRCIMHGHEDNHPSASIRLSEEGFYAYYCYSCYGAGNGQTLIDLIVEATSCDVRETIFFVEQMLGVSVSTEHQKQCFSRCSANVSYITSSQFKTGEWEPLYRYMLRRRILDHYIYYVQQAQFRTSSDPILGEGVPIFYESSRETSRNMRRLPLYSKGSDRDSVMRKRNELAHLGLIGKGTNMDNPTFFKAQAYQESMGNPYHKEFIFIPEITNKLLSYSLQQIIDSKEVGERVKYRTRMGVLKARGEEVADRIYVQDAGETISKFGEDFIKYLWKTLERLTRKGWTTEGEIVEEIRRESRYSNVKQLVGQLRPLITNGKRYTLQRVTNELQSRLKLPESIRVRFKIIVPVDQDQEYEGTRE